MLAPVDQGGGGEAVDLGGGHPHKCFDLQRPIGSVSTIKNTEQSVIDKLQVSDRTQAAVMAVRGGLLEE